MQNVVFKGCWESVLFQRLWYTYLFYQKCFILLCSRAQILFIHCLRSKIFPHKYLNACISVLNLPNVFFPSLLMVYCYLRLVSKHASIFAVYSCSMCAVWFQLEVWCGSGGVILMCWHLDNNAFKTFFWVMSYLHIPTLPWKKQQHMHASLHTHTHTYTHTYYCLLQTHHCKAKFTHKFLTQQPCKRPQQLFQRRQKAGLYSDTKFIKNTVIANV